MWIVLADPGNYYWQSIPEVRAALNAVPGTIGTIATQSLSIGASTDAWDLAERRWVDWLRNAGIQDGYSMRTVKASERDEGWLHLSPASGRPSPAPLLQARISPITTSLADELAGGTGRWDLAISLHFVDPARTYLKLTGVPAESAPRATLHGELLAEMVDWMVETEMEAYLHLGAEFCE